MTKFAGSDWIRESLKKPMSAIGVKAADILGEAYCGIYHLPHNSVRNTDWADVHCVKVWVYDDLSTCDAETLTTLVIMCHEQCVRMTIRAHNRRRLCLWFSPRDRDAKSRSYTHPTIEQAIELVRRPAK